MDKLVKYDQILKKLLKAHAASSKQTDVLYPEVQVIIDSQHHHYMLYRVGWFGRQRVRAVLLYIHIHENKIWIEEDGTEDGVATDLLDAGVPNEDIVLAFHHPDVRPLTEFAVA